MKILFLTLFLGTISFFSPKIAKASTQRLKLVDYKERQTKTLIANVMDYGAIANGVTDDYSAICKALNSGSKFIYLPTGVYRTTGEIKIPSNVTIYGDGYKSIIKFERINHTANHQSGYALWGVDLENVSIKNLKVDCSLANVVIAAIRFEGAKNLILYNIWLNKPYNGGILFGGPQFFGGKKVSENCIANSCKVTEVQYYNQSTGYACFTAAGGSKNCSFKDCDVISNVCDAYSSDYAYNTKFVNCSFFGSAGAGFTAEGEQKGETRNVYYEHCIADLDSKAGTGFFISENTNAYLNDCIVKNLTGVGISVGVFLQNANTVIDHCKFYNLKTPTGGYGGGAILAQFNNEAGQNPVVKVNNCQFFNNTFDIANYNLTPKLVTMVFNNCKFSDPVNTYFVAGKYRITYLNCIFKASVSHALQKFSSAAYYKGCKFYDQLIQGTNGIDHIILDRCIFYAAAYIHAKSSKKAAITVVSNSPNNAVQITDSQFFGFLEVVNDVPGKTTFRSCKFIDCIHVPPVVSNR